MAESTDAVYLKKDGSGGRECKIRFIKALGGEAINFRWEDELQCRLAKYKKFLGTYHFSSGLCDYGASRYVCLNCADGRVYKCAFKDNMEGVARDLEKQIIADISKSMPRMDRCSTENKQKGLSHEDLHWNQNHSGRTYGRTFFSSKPGEAG